MKTYSGLKGHEKEENIQELILKEKGGGTGFRDIADLITSEFGVRVSHTSVSGYYKDVLSGAFVDMALAAAKGTDGASGGDLSPVEIDSVRLEQLQEKYAQRTDREVGQLIAYATALCEHNLQQHIEGVAPLKQGYVKYLKEVRLMAKSDRLV